MAVVQVHFAPELVELERFPGGVAVVIDVLRATTTMTHALAAGCLSIRPCGTIQEARRLAVTLPGRVLLAGERAAQPVADFDLGNSPHEFTPERCGGATLVMTTSNGTRALLHAAGAERIYVAAFANLSAVRERLATVTCPIHILCSGNNGAVAQEDVLLAGALVEALPGVRDSCTALAVGLWRRTRDKLEHALRATPGGVRLIAIGYDEDVATAARIDTLTVVPEMYRDPLRVERAADDFAVMAKPTVANSGPPDHGHG